MPDLVTVQLDAVDALAARLAGLGGELTADAELTRVCAPAAAAALPGPAGAELAGTGTAWSALLDVLAESTSAIAATLVASVAAYRALDASLDAAITQRISGRYGLTAVAA